MIKIANNLEKLILAQNKQSNNVSVDAAAMGARTPAQAAHMDPNNVKKE